MNDPININMSTGALPLFECHVIYLFIYLFDDSGCNYCVNIKVI